MTTILIVESYFKYKYKVNGNNLGNAKLFAAFLS